MAEKLTKYLKGFSDRHIYPSNYFSNIFDNNSNIIIKTMCAIVMFGVIGFILAGIISIILDLDIFEFVGIGFSILLLYIVYRLLGIIFAFALLILLPLIIFLLF